MCGNRGEGGIGLHEKCESVMSVGDMLACEESKIKKMR